MEHDAVVDLTEEEGQGEEGRVHHALAAAVAELQTVDDSLVNLTARRDALRRQRDSLTEQVQQLERTAHLRSAKWDSPFEHDAEALKVLKTTFKLEGFRKHQREVRMLLLSPPTRGKRFKP
jgi:hypothetical protein